MRTAWRAQCDRLRCCAVCSRQFNRPIGFVGFSSRKQLSNMSEGKAHSGQLVCSDKETEQC